MPPAAAIADAAVSAGVLGRRARRDRHLDGSSALARPCCLRRCRRGRLAIAPAPYTSYRRSDSWLAIWIAASLVVASQRHRADSGRRLDQTARFVVAFSGGRALSQAPRPAPPAQAARRCGLPGASSRVGPWRPLFLHAADAGRRAVSLRDRALSVRRTMGRAHPRSCDASADRRVRDRRRRRRAALSDDRSHLGKSNGWRGRGRALQPGADLVYGHRQRQPHQRVRPVDRADDHRCGRDVGCRSA